MPKSEDNGNNHTFIKEYIENLAQCLELVDVNSIIRLAEAINKVRTDNAIVYTCGNGGSSENANHFVNDLLYGVTHGGGAGVKAVSLCSNDSVMTCLANDIGYENIFSYQIETLARSGDILVVFTGSGNSENIVRALDAAKKIGICCAGIIGFDGGKSLAKLDIPVHIKINDMQIAEDAQQIITHMITKIISQLK